MKFGHFDDARKEYVITTPRTPLPWINYLGSEDTTTLIIKISREKESCRKSKSVV